MTKQVILITGASSGIGAAVAREYAPSGAALGLLARRENRLAEVAEEVRKLGGEALPVVCDVGDLSSVRSAVTAVQSSLGPIDIAIANAGIALKSRAVGFKVSDAEMVVRTNVLGMMYLFESVIPSMLERGTGQFVGIASLAGLRGLPGSPVYSASKAAMQTFLEGMRAELRMRGISVTTINPGFVRSEITRTNEVAMPFILDVEEAAAKIVAAITRRESVYEFPLPMKMAVRTLRLLPDAIYDRIAMRMMKKRKAPGTR